MLGDRPNQLERQRDDVSVTGEQLTDVSTTPGVITTEGLRTNIRVGLTYLAAWLGGSGAVAIDNLMEDAATVEISRMQSGSGGTTARPLTRASRSRTSWCGRS